MWFWQKEKPDISLSKRVETCEKAILELKTKVFGLEMDNAMLRDKVLRKIQFKKEQETAESGGESKDIYNGVLIREHGD